MADPAPDEFAHPIHARDGIPARDSTGRPVRAPRPALVRRQRRGSRLAGAFALPLVALGLATMVLPLVSGFVLLVVAGATGGVAYRPGVNGGLHQFRAGLARDPGMLPWIVGFEVASVAVLALAVAVSFWILGAHRVPRRHAVTWAGLGVAVLAQVVTVPAIVLLVEVFGFSVRGIWQGWDLLVAAVVAGATIALAVTGLTGAYCWWWMAHVLRPAGSPRR